MKVTIRKHPELDFFIGYFGNHDIPTKQDKFQPINSHQVILNEEHDNPYDLYIKKRGKDNLKKFEEHFRAFISKNTTEEHPYKRDIRLEVIISFYMTEKRLKEVDIDNLVKAILDCFCGLIFEDDSQVINILAKKQVHPVVPKNGIMIGIRKINSENESWFNNIKLAYFEQA